MKLAYCTRGWHGYSPEEHLTLAKEMGFAGVEIAYAEAIPRALERPFAADRRTALLRRLSELEIAIPCVSAGGDLAGDTEATLERARACMAFASALHIPYVHLRAARNGDENADEKEIARLLETLLPQAERERVTLLIETSGLFADTARLRDLLDHFACDQLAALWDLHHSFRFGRETPERTVQNLGAYVRHVHVRDSVMEGGEVAYRLIGEGDLPLSDMLYALRSIDYDGYLSFVWTEASSSEFYDAGVVFPHYISAMRRALGEGEGRVRYRNRAGTGEYLFPRDRLIPLTFSEVLDAVVREFPDQWAFRFTTLDYARTYAEFRDDVDDFARALIALHIKPGDHVAVWATNVPQWYIAFWATVKIGAVLVTMNTAYKLREAEYLLRQSDARLLVLIDGYREVSYVDIIQTLCPELETADPARPLHCRRLPFLRHIVTVSSRQKGCLTWEDALARGGAVPVEEVYRRAAEVHPDDVCNMQYTSGTTGFPKGVMLTHRNIVNNGKCIGDRMDLSTADRMMIQVPMFHCFGMVLAMTAAMTHAAMLSPLPYFSPKPALACINQERITCFHGVPTMFIAMLEHEDFAKTDFSRMRTGIMAGSPCPVSVMRDVIEKMGMREVTIVYGQTEASPGCTMSETSDSIEVRVSTVGRPLPEIECRIVDPETGLEVETGVDGEFVVRGYNLMKGYYKMPRETEAAIDRDGWLHTGDVACRTPEGNFRITGRLKDMIIRGGENIYPKEIEELLYTHEKVRDVQVIGVPDARYGEEIMACVVLREGETMGEDDVRRFVAERLAKHKTPRYVAFVEGFPMNAAGKILKYKMREDAIQALGLHSAP